LEWNVFIVNVQRGGGKSAFSVASAVLGEEGGGRRRSEKEGVWNSSPTHPPSRGFAGEVKIKEKRRGKKRFPVLHFFEV